MKFVIYYFKWNSNVAMHSIADFVPVRVDESVKRQTISPARSKVWDCDIIFVPNYMKNEKWARLITLKRDRLHDWIIYLPHTHPFSRSLHQSSSFFSTLKDLAVSSVTVSCITSWTYHWVKISILLHPICHSSNTSNNTEDGSRFNFIFGQC